MNKRAYMNGEEKPPESEALEQAREKIPNEKTLEEISRIFKVLSDPTRIEILSALSEGELCVHELSELLDISQSAVSHQLRILRNARIVKFRRSGRKIFYSLEDEHVERLLSMGRKHAKEE